MNRPHNARLDPGWGLFRRGLLWGGVALAICAGCAEKERPAPPPRAELGPVIDWLSRHYRTSPLGMGWKVTSVGGQENQVQIMVEIPADQASGIKRRPADDQFRFVAERTCPGKDEAVWRLLPAGSSVDVLPSVSGQVFIEVHCGP